MQESSGMKELIKNLQPDQFDDIVATRVAIANLKLYINREEGFIGTGLKKDEYVCDCSDIDNIVVFQRD